MGGYVFQKIELPVLTSLCATSPVSDENLRIPTTLRRSSPNPVSRTTRARRKCAR